MSSCPQAGHSPAAFNCYLHDVGRHALLTHDQERELTHAMRSGNRQARGKVVAGNLRLVIHIAKNYNRSNLPRSGMSMDDLVSEGNIGLLRAIAKFNPSLGFRFSTYATHWIHEAIRRGIMNQDRLIRLPVHVAKRLNVYLAAQKRLAQKSYQTPRSEDIALATGDSPDCVRELMAWQNNSSSLQAQDEGSQSTWQDSFADDDARSPAEQAERDDLMFHLQRFIAQLKPREQHILCARFGMGKRSSEATLESIADEIGVTRERIRQIQIHALRQLREWLIEAGYDASCISSLDE